MNREESRDKSLIINGIKRDTIHQEYAEEWEV